MVFFQHHVESGSLDILPERDSFLPGETITGVVMLHLPRPLTNTTLTIALMGHEDLHAVYKDHDGDDSTTSGLHRLVHQRVVLGQGPLAAGDLCVPFTIPIPQGLPPTKQVEYVSDREVDNATSRLRIKIQYSLQCQLNVRDASAKSLVRDMPIEITSWPAVRPVGEPVTAEAAHTFRYNALTKKGACTVRARIATNVVSVGALLSVHVWLTIAPPARLRCVDLSLLRKIVAHTKSTRNHADTVQRMCTQRFDKVLLGETREFVMELPVNEASAPVVLGVRKTQPFHPSETFHHFSVAYEVLVECKVRSCKTVEVRIPVAFEAERGDAVP